MSQTDIFLFLILVLLGLRIAQAQFHHFERMKMLDAIGEMTADFLRAILNSLRKPHD